MKLFPYIPEFLTIINSLRHLCIRLFNFIPIVEKLVQKMSDVTYGNTLDSNYDMGPLINKKAQENAHRHVQKAIKDGVR